MMSLNEVRAALTDRNIQQVAKSTGISAASIYRLMQRDYPSYRILKALSDYLSRS